LALVVLGWLPAKGAERLPPAAQWIPAEAVIAVELAEPKPILDLALNPRLAAAVTAMPVYEKAAAQPGFKQALGFVRYLESQLGTDWKTGLRKLVDGGITWAVEPKGGSLLVVDAQDEAILAKLHEVLLAVAKADAATRGDPERVKSADYRGVSVWSLGKDEFHAVVGRRLLLANRAEIIRAALDLRANGEGKSLAALPAYQAAKKAAGPKAAASAFVHLAALKRIPAIEKALKGSAEPLSALLFSGLTETLRRSNWLALGLRIEGETLSLQAAVDGKVAGAEGAAAFTWPTKADEGAMANLSVPRSIAAVSLYRDLHGFYAAKDKLFPERTSGLIFFENMMGIFFSGRDLTEEVLSEAKPEIRFVVAAQQYDPAVGTPQMRLPAFAAVFRVRHPQEFAEVIEEAWQKAVGLVSFTRGQKGQGGLIIDRPTHAGTRFTMACFSTSRVEDKSRLDVQFNFRPALAKLGDYLVLSSTDGLAADLIDALKREMAGPVKPLAQVHSLAELDVGQLAAVLQSNRAAMIRQNMLEKGTAQEEAEAQIDVLLTLLKSVGRVTLSLANPDGQTRANLELKLNLPR